MFCDRSTCIHQVGEVNHTSDGSGTLTGRYATSTMTWMECVHIGVRKMHGRPWSLQLVL